MIGLIFGETDFPKQILKKAKSKKKLSPKQKKIAKKAPPYNKITGADFKKMKK